MYTLACFCVRDGKLSTVSEFKLIVTFKREGYSWEEITGDFF